MVQSLPIKPYNDALKGFASVCPARSERLICADLSQERVLAEVHQRRPDLILAIGMDALDKVRSIDEVPIVYLMALPPRDLTRSADNISGVSILIQAEKQLASFRQVLPQSSRVGILYDQDKTGAYVSKALAAANAAGLELVPQRIRSSREAVAALISLKERVDALWLIPDTTVLNPTNIDLLFSAAMEHSIPILAFSGKYLDMGALLSLEVNALDAGRQAGEMANRLLADRGRRSLGTQEARSGTLVVNRLVASKLGIRLNDSGRGRP